MTLQRSAMALLMLACCKGGAARAPSSAPTTRPTPQWVSVSEAQSERFMTDRCLDLAPPEAAEFDNPDFRECMHRSKDAVERAWDQIGERALKVCIETGEACCFERLPDGYDFVPPHHLPRNVSLFREKKRACDLECARKLDRQPTENATCRPSIVKAPHDPEHHRTAAMRTIVSECQQNPDAIAKCASLRGMVTRDTCKLECQLAHPPSSPPERVPNPPQAIR
jgi:hypothetical protein